MLSEQINYKVEDIDGNVVFKGKLLPDSLNYLVEDYGLSQMYTVYKLVDSNEEEEVYKLYNGVNTSATT